MTQRDNILQELRELESSLANSSPSTGYRVPGGYFEGLASQIMSRIKALEAADASGELEVLSPLLGSISRKTPYQAPEGYFDGLEKKLLEGVLHSETSQSADEELESLSSLLSGLKKEIPYSIPEGYFSTISIPTHTRKKEAKVISITSRKWFRYAAAAVVIGFVTISGLLIFNNNKTSADPEKIIQETAKIVDEKDVNNLIEMSDMDLLTEDASSLVASAEVKELVKSLSEEEIQNFVNETEITQSDLTDDILLN
jgi:hypothetical protein